MAAGGRRSAGPTGRAAGLPGGRLAEKVPESGEDFHALAALGGVRVEHIVSSASPDPGEQVQSWDEWVVVLRGSAELAVTLGGVAESRTLRAGDWVLIPAGTPHRVVRCAPGTHWLAVHGGGPPAES
jgi:hypothetical protein